VRVHLFVATLGYSRRLFVAVFRHERQDAWLDGIEGTFRHFGGVPWEVLLDNPKALVPPPAKPAALAGALAARRVGDGGGGSAAVTAARIASGRSSSRRRAVAVRPVSSRTGAPSAAAIGSAGRAYGRAVTVGLGPETGRPATGR
jgi:hypothetical protein